MSFNKEKIATLRQTLKAMEQLPEELRPPEINKIASDIRTLLNIFTALPDDALDELSEIVDAATHGKCEPNIIFFMGKTRMMAMQNQNTIKILEKKVQHLENTYMDLAASTATPVWTPPTKQ